MYALISVYDDTNKCICDSKVLLPDSVETTEYSDVPYKKHKFSFTVTTSKMYQAMVNGKFKHDDIPEPETNEWMNQEGENGRRAADDFVNKLDDISEEAKSEADFLKRHKRMMENSVYGLSVNQCMICKKVIYDDKAICDKCFEIAKREGFLE